MKRERTERRGRQATLLQALSGVAHRCDKPCPWESARAARLGLSRTSCANLIFPDWQLPCILPFACLTLRPNPFCLPPALWLLLEEDVLVCWCYWCTYVVHGAWRLIVIAGSCWHVSCPCDPVVLGRSAIPTNHHAGPIGMRLSSHRRPPSAPSRHLGCDPAVRYQLRAYPFSLSPAEMPSFCCTTRLSLL